LDNIHFKINRDSSGVRSAVVDNEITKTIFVNQGGRVFEPPHSREDLTREGGPKDFSRAELKTIHKKLGPIFRENRPKKAHQVIAT